ncbi:hypothetical protein [Streptomyces gobitricini]|uniref:hypothetical protein n=1 Tax=Streptomyces gobitricini TaxID=68211 RepID=UPI0031DB7480
MAADHLGDDGAYGGRPESCEYGSGIVAAAPAGRLPGTPAARPGRLGPLPRPGRPPRPPAPAPAAPGPGLHLHPAGPGGLRPRTTTGA